MFEKWKTVCLRRTAKMLAIYVYSHIYNPWLIPSLRNFMFYVFAAVQLKFYRKKHLERSNDNSVIIYGLLHACIIEDRQNNPLYVFIFCSCEMLSWMN